MKRDTFLAAASLALLIPAPTIGALSAMVFFPETLLGKSLYVLSKAWLLLFPVLWYVYAERGRVAWPKPTQRGMAAGVISGLAIMAVILAAYFTIGTRTIDAASLRDKAVAFGLTSPALYVAGGAYAVFVNALLEEYVWRWFVVRQFERLLPAWVAVAASAVAFSLHHAFALATFLPVPVALLAATGVGVGGLVWSWLYHAYRSVWPGYVSHALADVGVLVAGYCVLFA
jgi:membrane protease YdiL (CAAX protease family)